MGQVTETCCRLSWWWAIVYTACIVFSAFHGDTEYTRHTGATLCHLYQQTERRLGLLRSSPGVFFFTAFLALVFAVLIMCVCVFVCIP